MGQEGRSRSGGQTARHPGRPPDAPAPLARLPLAESRQGWRSDAGFAGRDAGLSTRPPTSVGRAAVDPVRAPQDVVPGPGPSEWTMSPTRRAEALEQAARELLFERVQSGRAFTIPELVRELERREPALGRPEAIARAVRGLIDEGLLAPFGYRSTIAKTRSTAGWISRFEMAPSAPPTGARASRRPTRRPAGRPLGYLDVDPAAARRLGRQIEAVRERLAGGTEQLLHTGEILDAARRLVGGPGFARFVRRELELSPTTARRMIHAARALAHHPLRSRILGAPAGVIYKLSEPSFPSALREAILAADGLVVDGETRRIPALRVADLQAAKAALERREAGLAAWQRAEAHARRRGDAAGVARARARIAELGRRAPTEIRSPAADARSRARLARLGEEARRLTGQLDPESLSGGLRRRAAAALAALARSLDAPTGSEVPVGSDFASNQSDLGRRPHGVTRILAIDGPAGAGKSTVARRVAERLGWVRVDTGALYRTAALIATRLELTEESEIAEALLASDIQIVDGVVRLDGAPVGVAIRSPAMSRRASEVSAMPAVRAALLDVQRRVARSAAAGAVLEGRDIGTVVFPDADVKVFLTASAEERARRRTDELAASGRHVDYQVVLADIVERDARDTGRAVAPLKQAADAVAVDSTALGADAVVERIVSLVRERLG